MSANVFANGREVSGKASSNQSIAAMPDVCMSPPPPPAGPVPIPYPNTSMASDTTDGSKTVLVGGEEAGLKNASSYKKSNGDEPATNNFGANLITHGIQGPTHFVAWSFDVQFEGQNAVRLMDMTSHNDSNPPGGAVTMSTGEMSVATPNQESCKELQQRNSDSRGAMKDAPRQGVKDLAPGENGLPAHPNAIAHASVTAGGQGGTFFGASSRSVLNPKDNAGCKGLSGPGDSKNVCPGKPFPFTGRHQFHAEAKILENVPLGGGVPTVRLAVNWLSKKAPHSTAPCRDCKRLMEHACQCMNIEVCGPDNQAESRCP
jgi:Domain of unknown function (DUF4150)